MLTVVAEICTGVSVMSSALGRPDCIQSHVIRLMLTVVADMLGRQSHVEGGCRHVRGSVRSRQSQDFSLMLTVVVATLGRLSRVNDYCREARSMVSC